MKYLLLANSSTASAWRDSISTLQCFADSYAFKKSVQIQAQQAWHNLHRSDILDTTGFAVDFTLGIAMTTDPHWTAYLTALLTPTLAVLGAHIAYRQWQLAQNKLKFDLFDRRFQVYEAARNLLASIMTSGKAQDDEVMKFRIATREARWLLSQDVADYLDKQLHHKALDLQCLASELKGVGVGETRTKNVYAQADIKTWCMAQYDVLDQKFSPFLQLQH